MRKLIIKTMKISHKEWIKKLQNYKNDLMYFDQFNKKRRSSLTNI